MSLEEKANNAVNKLTQIIDTANLTQKIISQGFEKLNFSTIQITFSDVDKQKLLTWYSDQKKKLQQLINELP